MAATKFEGWFGFDKETGIGGMKWQEFEPKKFDDTDLDIKITHCGVCGTDVHSLRSGLFPTDFPCCAGHEIVGNVSQVGSKAVGGFKVGDVVGVGSQIGSCSDCDACSSGKQNFCPKLLGTYGSRYPDGQKTYGGFASHWRGPSAWVFAIPEGMSPAEAAPMLCGGITLYSPLKRFGCGPGKNVGIVGAGGLGHFGILFAKALGAEKVVALSRGTAKKDDMLKLGATDYISTDEDTDWATKHASTLDIIICTVSSPQIPFDGLLTLLRTNGAFVQLGAPALPPLNMFPIIFKGLSISGSLIGPPAQIREMLEFAIAHNIHPMIQERKMTEANQVVQDMDKGLARFRYVLVN